MEYTSIKIKDLIEKSESKEILLPNFQREYVWDRKSNQKALLASILYDIPIGSLLILNGESGFFATKELCIRQQFSDETRDSTLYLLDGQQRTSTIKSIFYDFFNEPQTWKENFDKLYPRLRTRWLLRVKPKENEMDIFGWRKLKFNGSIGLNEYSPDEITEFIKPEILKIKEIEKWYHPEYKKDKWYEKGKVNTNTRRNVISKKAAEEGEVPLYTIIGNEEKTSTTLHYKTLKKIAQDRVAELKALVEDNKLDINSILDDYEEENLDEAWNGLSSDWVNDIMVFLSNISEKEIPIIQLVKDEMSKAIYTFERVNKGGTALSTYDLVVAKAAYNKDSESLSLTDRIINIINKQVIIPESISNSLKKVDTEYIWEGKNMELLKDNELSTFMKNQYLNLLSIFSYFEYEVDIDKISLEYIKKDKHLNIEPRKINDNTEITIKSLIRACAFLQFRCGIVKATDLSYQLMILPIAYILRDDKFWNDNKVIDKIEYWYWTSLFGGIYRTTPNEQCINDIKKLFNFIQNGKNEFGDRESRVLKVEDYSSYETLVFRGQDKKVPSAVHNGILQYILSKQPKDFVNDDIELNPWEIAKGKDYKSAIKNGVVKLSVQDHHICPLSSTTKLGQATKEIRDNPNCILNSPLNRTYISANANNIIRDKKAEDYFKYVSNLAKYGHCIPSPIEDKYKKNSIESNDEYFERVIKQRYDEILRELEQELDALK
ncbi:DUF262 domain-containing protein [Clostridium botulinum]|uniref:DUF262 domain-containing protein n=1 Tax=Clostridium botulinum TaxID=1491 RepID=UPI000773109F|nr:DUF262 domain-containing protein [Clostridium botulinum]AUN03599.1 hypothetical protein RSJ19_12020 [Clostridium botulinum]MBN3399147.1 hypothetical protein [Clostridium botulinum]MBN3412570.1 hypothetical protein [Clostridium botulinum]